jgi:hypothetical protein
VSTTFFGSDVGSYGSSAVGLVLGGGGAAKTGCGVGVDGGAVDVGGGVAVGVGAALGVGDGAAVGVGRGVGRGVWCTGVGFGVGGGVAGVAGVATCTV